MSVLNLAVQNIFYEIYGQSALHTIWKVFYLVKVRNYLIISKKCPKIDQQSLRSMSLYAINLFLLLGSVTLF